MKKFLFIGLLIVLSFSLIGCTPEIKGSDQVQKEQNERLLAEATAQTGMPAIKNFRERKLLKDILELRDQDGLVTYLYWPCEYLGKLIYLGSTIGYPIPYATQYTNPQKVAYARHQTGVATLPQADPNGLFNPASAEGTWILMKDPNGQKTLPIYCEQRIMASPFKLKGSHVVYPEGVE